MWRRTVSIVWIIAAGLFPGLATFEFVYLSLPREISPSLADAYRLLSESVGGLIVTVVIWGLLVTGVSLVGLSRLNVRPRWSLDYPYSPWRTTRLALLISGVVGFLSIYPSSVMNSSLERLVPYSDRIQEPEFSVYLLVSMIMLTLGLALLASDVIATKLAIRAQPHAERPRQDSH